MQNYNDDTGLAVASGVAQGFEKATENLLNISMASNQLKQKSEMHAIAKKKGELELKEMELVGMDPEVINAKRSIFTINAKTADLQLKGQELVLSEAQKKAKKDIEDRKKEAEWMLKLENGEVPNNLQVETKIGDTTVSNKKSGTTDDLFSAAGNGQTPIATPEEREVFLGKLSPENQAVVKGLSDYSLDLSKISSYRGNQRLQLAQAVKMYDPSFDMTQFPTRQKFQQEFTSGSKGKNVTSFNTAIAHLEELSRAVDKVPSGNVKALTGLRRFGAEHLAAKGKTAVGMTEEKAAITAVSGELATIFKNTGGTDQEIEKWFKAYDPNASKEQKMQFIKTGVDLMVGRLDALNGEYERTMGKPNGTPLISKKTETALNRLSDKFDGVEGPAKGFVRMQDEQGNQFDIPEANVAKAKERKFTEVTNG